MIDKLTILLSALHGVEITWKQSKGDWHQWHQQSPRDGFQHPYRLGFKVQDQRSLSLIAHVAVSSNVLLSVEVDWNCDFTHKDDPDCLRYDLRFKDETDIEVFLAFLEQDVKIGH